MGNLTGKVAIVTGASRGIGRGNSPGKGHAAVCRGKSAKDG
jgi:NADP-dependent 3-hydroxy acid dehydrogenase YdfG